MKKSYEKPALSMECFRLDSAIALNCGADRETAAQIQGAYEEALAQTPGLTLGEFISIMIGAGELSDTYCYHTNVNVLFNS